MLVKTAESSIRLRRSCDCRSVSYILLRPKPFHANPLWEWLFRISLTRGGLPGVLCIGADFGEARSNHSGALLVDVSVLLRGRITQSVVVTMRADTTVAGVISWQSCLLPKQNVEG